MLAGIDTIVLCRHDAPCALVSPQSLIGLPPWHSELFASRLIAMRRTDLESGVIEREVSVIQWRQDANLERCGSASCVITPHLPRVYVDTFCAQSVKKAAGGRSRRKLAVARKSRFRPRYCSRSTR